MSVFFVFSRKGAQTQRTTGKLCAFAPLREVLDNRDLDPDTSNYLNSCSAIDCSCPIVHAKAEELAADTPELTTKRCFEFVRDEIKHSSDFQLNPVTCSASSVLEHGTGYCYAKSHLLCALLRANKIPAGLCYQRLSIDGEGPPFCLHGLVAVYLPEFGWYRIDPRGNREGIDAQFDPPTERLAFPTDHPEERDLPGIYASPLPEVVEALAKHATWDELYRNLPDAS